MPFTGQSGVNIWYETRGEGYPLVMVNGLGGNRRGWWDEFPALLAEQHTVVTFDNRGTGRSERPAAPWTMKDMTADLLAVADALELEQFHLLGGSLGTVVVRAFVGEHGGERVRSLSLLCAPNGINAPEEEFREAFAWDASKTPLEFARAGWRMSHPDDWVAENEALLIQKFEEGLAEATPPLTLHAQLQAAQGVGDPNPPLNDHDFPVLIVHGTADRMVPPENAFLLSSAVPRARLELLDGAAHNFWAHRPGPAAAILLDFLASA